MLEHKVGVGGMGWKNGTIFEFCQGLFFKVSFWSLKKVKKNFFENFHFWRIARQKTEKNGHLAEKKRFFSNNFFAFDNW